MNTLGESPAASTGVLNSMGIHIGPAVRGLGGTGIASREDDRATRGPRHRGPGRRRGDGGLEDRALRERLFDLDDVIGKATAKLLGWGDVAGQVALNNADQLARATQRVGYEVTNLTDALAINLVPIGEWRSNAKLSADATTGWHQEIAKVRAAGNLDSLTGDLASQNFTLKDLAARYHLSVEAIQVFVREQGHAATAVEAANARMQARTPAKLATSNTRSRCVTTRWPRRNSRVTSTRPPRRSLPRPWANCRTPARGGRRPQHHQRVGRRVGDIPAKCGRHRSGPR